MFKFRDWDIEPDLEGIFAGQYTNIGKFKKNVFSFKVVRAGKKTVEHSWALVGLSNVLHGVPFGTRVKIKFTGWEQMPDSDRKYKHFDIEILDPPSDE